MSTERLGDRLRKMLLINISGMTIKQMSDADGTPQESILSAMYRNYGFYICGWSKVRPHQYVAIWNCVRVPANSPKPKGTFEQVDVIEALKAREREERKKRRAEERAHEQEANRKLRAQLAAQREHDKEIVRKAKEERKALRIQEQLSREVKQIKVKHKVKLEKVQLQPVLYVPQRTHWIPVQPWK